MTQCLILAVALFIVHVGDLAAVSRVGHENDFARGELTRSILDERRDRTAVASSSRTTDELKPSSSAIFCMSRASL